MSKAYKTLICGGEISLAVLDTTALVAEAARRHALTPVAAAALGRTLTAGAYLCSWLKEERSSLSVTIRGNGAGGVISVAGDGALYLRGYAENNVSLPLRADGKLDVGGFVGREGTLAVVRDDGEKLPFAGTVSLVSGEIAEDFSAYFLESEQRPTALALGVRVSGEDVIAAGGVFLQPLPFAGEESIRFAEERIARYGDVSKQIGERGAEGILRDFGAECTEVRDIFFRCSCSRRRVAALILSLGREEAEALLRERGSISVHCHYCNTDYEFTPQETRDLFGGENP